MIVCFALCMLIDKDRPALLADNLKTCFIHSQLVIGGCDGVRFLSGEDVFSALYTRELGEVLADEYHRLTVTLPPGRVPNNLVLSKVGSSVMALVIVGSWQYAGCIIMI